jgi:predicted lipoprotein with Yx(FWY)xxD motif
MSTLRTMKLRATGIAAVVTCALVLAACGSASSSSTSSTAAATPAAAATTSSTTSTTSTAAAAGGITIGTSKAHGQTYLTGASGRSIYLWVADKGDMSSCSGACAQAWPPVTTTAKPAAGSGVTAADLGTTKRSDGSEQVTYKGHPLYYFVADKTAGSTAGQGSDSFGAKWWLVAPSGSAITSGGSSSGGSSGGSSSSSSSSGGWG